MIEIVCFLIQVEIGKYASYLDKTTIVLKGFENIMIAYQY